MASQEPSGSSEELGPYERAWVEITQALDGGASWSGRERNVAYLSRGDGQFVDASGLSGLDLIDDARAVVATDWDGDGDLDLWLRNRTGPQLRLMANTTNPGDRWIAFELVGSRANRDAIGARVVLETESDGVRASIAREVIAGDGYLAQSSLRQHFGLAAGEKVIAVTVHWPAGDGQRFESPAPGHLHRLSEDSLEMVGADPARATLAPRAFAAETPIPGRVVLRTPFPLPPMSRQGLPVERTGPQAALLNLWSIDCVPCLRELVELSQHHAQLEDLDLALVPLCIDQGEAADRARAFLTDRVLPAATGTGPRAQFLTDEMRALIESLLAHTLAQEGHAALPTSLLVDRAGWVQVIYVGPVSPETLLADAAIYAPGPRGADARDGYPGRWFFGVPRDWSDLARHLESRGRTAEARFYRILARREGR
ncbi:MAG: ASPIC/UnbV domain-containing protein [Planctomycetota bacterium]|nr:ASPIC/UnbV domain-containing protein [Planctomycetota bacterium]